MVDSLQSQMPIKPDQILEIIIRRKWFIIIPLCITLTAGLLHTLTTKKTYQASTLILVQPQRVPTNYVRSVVTSTINQRISTISQQILSRSNLEKIIDQFGLFENAHDMYLEDKIASMRKQVQVKIERARHGAEAFSIVFKGREPQTVMRIANTLASYFMDENLKVREAQAVGTSEFLDSELEKTRRRLEKREQQLADYRKKHWGGLPNELETNLRTLDRLQREVNARRVQLRDVQKSLTHLETQMAQMQTGGTSNSDEEFSSLDLEEPDVEETTEELDTEKKLEVATEEYEAMLLVYTEKHPDVAKLKRVIDKLEKEVEEEKKEQLKVKNEETSLDQKKSSAETDTVETTEAVLPNFAVLQFNVQKTQLQNEIKQMQTDISKKEEEMKIYQKRVEDTPKRQLEMQSMQRDYKNIKDVYNSLLNRKLEAELSVNMEKKQKGEQFRILDHARLPEKPISPNVQMLFLLSIVAGLGVAGGVIFLLEFFDTSIRREDQIEKDLGLRILAAVPPLKRAHDKMRKRIEWIAFACFCTYASGFLAFFAVLNYKGLDRTINFIKSIINI